MQTLMEYGNCETLGKTHMRRAIHQLEQSGYAVRHYTREGGRITGLIWHWHDTPVPMGKRSKPIDHLPKVGLLTSSELTSSLPKISNHSNNKKDHLQEDHKKESRVLSKERMRGYSGSSLEESPDIEW